LRSSHEITTFFVSFCRRGRFSQRSSGISGADP
jgi:hypothetical protein